MANDLWQTPDPVFNVLNREFDFVADMAASKKNAKCDLFFTEKDDSLNIDWFNKTCIGLSNNQYVWLNCPYSDPMPWVKKASEAQKDGLGVVMLLNSDNSVGWFAEALKTVSEIRFIIADETPNKKRGYSSGRLAFIDEHGKTSSGNNKPQVIFVFNPFNIGTCVTSYVKKSDLYK